MAQWIHRHQIPKIKELLDDFYDKNVGTRAGYVSDATEEEKIERASLDFLTFNLGKVWQDITDDSNLNSEIINIFAQDFIRQFWNNRIAYTDTMTFYIKLRGFMDQWLPVWGQFYKEAILDKEAFITNLGTVTANDNGLIHVDGTNKGTTTSKGKNGNITKGDSSSITTGFTNGANATSTDNTTDGKNSSETTNDQSQITTGTDTTEKQDNTTTDTQNMSLTSDTPQDAINARGFSQAGKDAKPLSAYDFNYASNANGQHTLTSADTSGKDTVTHDTKVETADISDVKGTTNEVGKTSGANVTNSANASATTDKNLNSVSGVTSLKGTNSTKQINDTTSQNANVTNSKARGLTLTQIAREFDEMANGAYLQIFVAAKKAGLFLGVY